MTADRIARLWGAARRPSPAARAIAAFADLPGLAGRWRRFSGNQAGAAGILVAFALPALIGMVGLGVEIGAWYVARRHLQIAADAAAVAGAIEVGLGNAGAMAAAAEREAVRNGFVVMSPDVITVNNKPRSGGFTNDPLAVEVILTQPQQPMFSALFLKQGPALAVRAVARTQAAGDACILALDPQASSAVDLSGNTVMTLRNCVVATNSSSSSSIDISGHAQLTATSLRTVGGYTGSAAAAGSPPSVPRPPTPRRCPIPTWTCRSPVPGDALRATTGPPTMQVPSPQGSTAAAWPSARRAI